MIGSISSSVALSLLGSLSGTGTPDLVSILNGTAGGVSGGDPVAALKLAEKNQTKEIAQQEKDPQTKSEITHFLAAVARAPDLKTLLADPIARKVFLTANGLGDQTDYPGLATKALSSNPNDTKSLAAKLTNSAWKATVKTYDFAEKGLSVLKQQSALDSITSGYAQVVLGHAKDKVTPGISAALDFRTRAHTVTTVDGILGDANIRAVVTGALGIPQQIAFQPLSTQERAISSRMDVKKLQDPKFVEQLAQRYLIEKQMTQTSQTGINTPLTSLLA